MKVGSGIKMSQDITQKMVAKKECDSQGDEASRQEHSEAGRGAKGAVAKAIFFFFITSYVNCQPSVSIFNPFLMHHYNLKTDYSVLFINNDDE